MKELILNLHDFLKTGAVEVENYRYNGMISGVNIDICVSFKALKSSDKSVRIDGMINGFAELECSLCLDLYKYEIKIPVHSNINADNSQVDVGEDIRQLLLLELPMKPVCSQDCLGICKVCGRHNKKNDSCSCTDNIDESTREMWKELLNIKRRK
ncbi:MAG: DUF177 domain-containing protein [Endomicrobium sp.]|jgi:uncharacterized protein|nr:DUF177 domain-containing protein [Endomicrobium sp.]